MKRPKLPLLLLAGALKLLGECCLTLLPIHWFVGELPKFWIIPKSSHSSAISLLANWPGLHYRLLRSGEDQINRQITCRRKNLKIFLASQSFSFYPASEVFHGHYQESLLPFCSGPKGSIPPPLVIAANGIGGAKCCSWTAGCLGTLAWNWHPWHLRTYSVWRVGHPYAWRVTP